VPTRKRLYCEHPKQSATQQAVGRNGARLMGREEIQEKTRMVMALMAWWGERVLALVMYNRQQ